MSLTLWLGHPQPQGHGKGASHVPPATILVNARNSKALAAAPRSISREREDDLARNGVDCIAWGGVANICMGHHVD